MLMKKTSLIATVVVSSIAALTALSFTPAKSFVFINSAAFSKIPVVAVKTATATSEDLFQQYVTEIYKAANLDQSNLSYSVFEKAVVGYYNLKHTNKVAKPVLSIVDFTKSSTQKRLWIIDLDKKQLLFNTLVAHGQGSGDDIANSFSNTEETHQSSLGFFVTDGTYMGKHGLSLKLDGMDQGINSNAKNRSIVMHAAAYVSEDFIKVHGRLGRSFGCPALPPELSQAIIDTVKGKSCLFINGADTKYNSAYLNPQIAVNDFTTASETVQASI